MEYWFGQLKDVSSDAVLPFAVAPRKRTSRSRISALRSVFFEEACWLQSKRIRWMRLTSLTSLTLMETNRWNVFRPGDTIAPRSTKGAVTRRIEADGNSCSKRSMDLIEMIAVSRIPSIIFEFQRSKVTLNVMLTLSDSLKQGKASIPTTSSEVKTSDGEVNRNERMTVVKVCKRKHEQHRQMQDRLVTTSSAVSTVCSSSSSICFDDSRSEWTLFIKWAVMNHVQQIVWDAWDPRFLTEIWIVQDAKCCLRPMLLLSAVTFRMWTLNTH